MNAAALQENIAMTGSLAVILVFGGLIFFHELGHFLAARSLGMGVKTFSLGFGPVLCSFKRGKTRYQVAALPLGGFVSLVGESPTAEVPDEFTPEESFSLRPAWQRFIVIAAGSVFNLLLAWLLCWGIFWSQGRMHMPPVVDQVLENTPAASSPLQPGDRIVNVDGKPIDRWTEIPTILQMGAGKSVVMTIERTQAGTITFSITPELRSISTPEGETFESWGIGISAAPPERLSFGFLESAKVGFDEAKRMGGIIWNAVGDLINRTVAFDNVGGPILIAQTIYKQTEHGIVSVLLLGAFISVNLGILNLLPIPVLDGGHLLFLLVEMAGRKPVPPKIQEKAMYLGLFLLLALMIAATFNDVMRFFQ